MKSCPNLNSLPVLVLVKTELELSLQHIDRAVKWAEASRKQAQLQYMFSNATVSLQSLLASYPGKLMLATIQVYALRNACIEAS